MSQLKRFNGNDWDTIGGSITGDTLPIGSEVDYDGNTVPAGWEQVPTGWTLIDNNIYYKKSGNMVTIMRQARDSSSWIQNETSLTAYDYTNITSSVPSGIRPSTRIAFPVFIHFTDNSFGTNTSYGEIQTDGKISIYNWNGAKTANRIAFCVTYIID